MNEAIGDDWKMSERWVAFIIYSCIYRGDKAYYISNGQQSPLSQPKKCLQYDRISMCAFCRGKLNKSQIFDVLILMRHINNVEFVVN